MAMEINNFTTKPPRGKHVTEVKMLNRDQRLPQKSVKDNLLKWSIEKTNTLTEPSYEMEHKKKKKKNVENVTVSGVCQDWAFFFYSFSFFFYFLQLYCPNGIFPVDGWAQSTN